MSDTKELSAEERDAKRTEAALAHFLERWRALPPLVRAGAADVLRQQSAISFNREDRDAQAVLAALMEAQKPGGEWHVRLWDAINAYAATTTSQTSVARQKAVVVVEAALRAARGES